MQKKRFGVLNADSGNVRSLFAAIERAGFRGEMINSSVELDNYRHIVIMGVGNFGHVSSALLAKFGPGLASALFAHSGPTLGICVGFQQLFQSSEESPNARGLAMMQGEVCKLPVDRLRPHVGWNNLVEIDPTCPLLFGISSEDDFYFTHNYFAKPMNSDVVAAKVEFGETFPAVVWRENIFGVQFHPEKSQAAGSRLLQNFGSLA